MRHDLPIRKKLLFSAISVVAALLFAELCLRIDVPASKPAVNGQVWTDPLIHYAITDPFLGYRNKPDCTFPMRQIVGSPISTTDQYGYRNGYGWPGDPDSPIVLFVGDSFVFGAEVSDDHTIPSEVAKLLDPNTRCLNAGVRGYNAIQAKRSIELALERFPGKIRVVVYVFCGNDVVETMLPDCRWPLPTPTVLKKDGQWIEPPFREPPLPWGTPLKGWDKLIPDDRPTPCWLEQHSRLWLTASNTVSLLRNIPPTGKYKALREEYLEATQTWAELNGGYDAIGKLMEDMQELCNRNAISFIVTYPQTGIPHQYEPDLPGICKDLNIAFLEPADSFPEARDFYCAERVDGLLDPHYNHEGTKAFARAVAPAIRMAL